MNANNASELEKIRELENDLAYERHESNRLRSKLSEVSDELDFVVRERNGLQGQVIVLSEDLKEKEDMINELNEKVADLESSVDYLEDELELAVGECNELRERYEELKKSFDPNEYTLIQQSGGDPSLITYLADETHFVIHRKRRFSLEDITKLNDFVSKTLTV